MTVRRIIPEPDPLEGFPWGLGKTEAANAKLLEVLYGSRLKFCLDDQKWYIWTGKHWKLSKDIEIIRYARRAIETLMEYSEKKGIRGLKNYCQRSLSDYKLRAVINLVKTNLFVREEEFEHNPYLFNVNNGTIHLRKGKFRPHHRNDFIRQLAPVEYNLKAECPRFMEFLCRITGGDLELMAFIQRIFGYCLSGLTREQKFFILYGPGANGKTTLLELFRALAGPYVQQADFRSFLSQRFDSGPRNDLAAMKGARMVIASETGHRQRLNEVLIKQLTGGESLRVRHLYMESFEYLPQFKLVLVTNHLPQVEEQSPAFWRRVSLIKLTEVISPEKQDKNLLRRLKQELPGILNWALEGCRQYLKMGLAEPEDVVRAGIHYKEDSDVVGSYIADRCDMDPTGRVKKSALWQSFIEWVKSTGAEPLNQAAFYISLRDRGMKESKVKGERFWKGIVLK